VPALGTGELVGVAFGELVGVAFVPPPPPQAVIASADVVSTAIVARAARGQMCMVSSSERRYACFMSLVGVDVGATEE
jgi:hypothetical protein